MLPRLSAENGKRTKAGDFHCQPLGERFQQRTKAATKQQPGAAVGEFNANAVLKNGAVHDRRTTTIELPHSRPRDAPG
jgi:hypothetical protein